MNTAQSKFFLTLKTLSPEELKSFEQFLQSPWCNTNKNIVRLLAKTKNYHPDFNTPKMQKEQLFQRILPNGKFSDRRMNNILSEANLAIEKFLAWQNFAKDPSEQKIRLAQEFQERKLHDSFFKLANRAIAVLENNASKDSDQEAALTNWYTQIYQNPQPHAKRPPDHGTIEKMGAQTTLVWLLKMGFILNQKLSRNRVFRNKDHDVKKDVEQWKAVSAEINHPAVELYRLRFAYNEEQRLEQYFHLRARFFAVVEKMGQWEQYLHFIALKNDTIQMIRAQYFDITELVPLYKFGLESEILLENGVLSHKNFSAAVSSANTKKDFGFTKKIIDEYSANLLKHYREEAVVWAQAHTYYYKGKYKQCLEVLMSQNFKVFYFSLSTRFLKTQTYFDLYMEDNSYQTLIYSHLDSVEKWLQRENFHSAAVKKSYLNFIQATRKITKAYDNPNKNININNILTEKENIQGGEWLMRKINEVFKLKMRST